MLSSMNKNLKENILAKIDSIYYSIKWNELIKDLSFEIEKNKVISIIWYNWSWKSTLLKLILGSIKTNKGNIFKKKWLNIWYVPQKLSFVQELPLTVKDFLSIYNKKNKLSKKISCSLLSVESLLKRPLNWLSGWQLQKVLIYNALLWNPEILLLDEPTAWLDIRAQKDFYKLIDHIHQEHKITIILVSHDIHTVYSNSDTVICLHKWLCCIWSPKDKWFHQELKDIAGGYVIPYLHTHIHEHDR